MVRPKGLGSRFALRPPAPPSVQQKTIARKKRVDGMFFSQGAGAGSGRRGGMPPVKGSNKMQLRDYFLILFCKTTKPKRPRKAAVPLAGRGRARQASYNPREQFKGKTNPPSWGDWCRLAHLQINCTSVHLAGLPKRGGGGRFQIKSPRISMDPEIFIP